MADFAEIRLDNNEVIRIVKISDVDVAAHGGNLSEEAENWVSNFIPNDLDLLEKKFNNIYPKTYWKQTFKDHSHRKNFAFVGGLYYPEHDGFAMKCPVPEEINLWNFNTTTWLWEKI